MKHISSLHIYPVKSFKGLQPTSVEVGSKGPFLDRRWMVVDKDDRFASQRTIPEMALLACELLEHFLVLRAPNQKPFFLPIGQIGPVREVALHKDTVTAWDQGDEAAAWVSQALNGEFRFVFLPDESTRKVNPKYAVSQHDQVSFADAYPFLLISEASLEELNNRLQAPVPMNRFRPNLVVANSAPFEEDTWKEIRIGEIVFDCVKPCSRCSLTCVDQATGEKGHEPLKTLATYRKREEGKIMFGQNLIQRTSGRLKIGDTLEVLKRHS